MTDALFSPVTLGAIDLANRIVMAPMTRDRAGPGDVPTDAMVEYYAQRASAGLIVTEGVYPSEMGKGYLFSPGLCTEAHAAGWQQVTEAVHEKGGAIFAQLMHVGRLSDPLMLSGAQPVGASAVQPDRPPLHRHLPAPQAPLPGAPRARHRRGVRGDRGLPAQRRAGQEGRFRWRRDPRCKRLSADAVPVHQHQSAQ